MLERSILTAALHGEDVLATLDAVGGTYDCPKNSAGERIGPLVGYAGQYRFDNGTPDGVMKNWVGDYYADFAYAEQHPQLYAAWANRIAENLEKYNLDVIIGAPEGGKAVAFAIAQRLGCRYVYPEKKIISYGDPKRRDETEMVFDRHFLIPGERAAIGEDVTNNLSTAGELIRLTQRKYAEVVVITSWLNRSGKQMYSNPGDGEAVPIESLLHREMAKYKQEDPQVAADVADGKVVWKAKHEFPDLRMMYEKHRKAQSR
jgi:adenine/guanine phosphoribosyltransferase-like PRPP-binding protein